MFVSVSDAIEKLLPVELSYELVVEGEYKGYLLINDLYEDSEGFYKNGWCWGTRSPDENFVYVHGCLDETSSYTKHDVAMQELQNLIDGDDFNV